MPSHIEFRNKVCSVDDTQKSQDSLRDENSPNPTTGPTTAANAFGMLEETTKKLVEEKTKLANHVAKAQVAEAPQPPWPKPGPDDVDPPFDPSIPGSDVDPMKYPGQDFLSKLRQMLEWMRLHPGNIKAIIVFFQFLHNYEGSKYAQDPEIKAVVDKLINTKVGDKTLLEGMLDVLTEAAFYGDQTSGCFDTAKDFLDKLKAYIAGDKDFHLDADIDFWKHNLDDPDWKKKHTDESGQKPNMSYDEFCIYAAKDWNLFIGDDQIKEIMNELFKLEMDIVIKRSGLKSNPMLLLMLLIFLKNDGDNSMQLGSYGDLSKWLQKRIEEINKEVAEWSKGNFDAGSAKDFIAKLLWLKEQAENPSAGDIGKLIGPQIDAILGLKVKVDGQETTIGDLFKSGNFQGLSDALNSLQPDPSGGTPIPPGFTTITNALQQISGAFSEQSQIVATIISKIANDEKVSNNMLQKYLSDDIITAIKNIISRFRGA